MKKLSVFEFIESTLDLYKSQYIQYESAEKSIVAFFSDYIEQETIDAIGVHSRIKTFNSLQEKLLRNKFYLDFSEPEEAISHLNDLIGITLECQFISKEHVIFRQLNQIFNRCGNDGFYYAETDSRMHLNIRALQPQIQKNGYTIYRIDGYFMDADLRINYEVQIKALVHRFWSEIEHEVVYKKQEMLLNNVFLTQLLGSVRDNLEVLDHQLEIIYQQMSVSSDQKDYGLHDDGFKQMAANLINELVMKKMNESVGFSTDFRKNASAISQYLYIRYLTAGGSSEYQLLSFIETINSLLDSEIDFKHEMIIKGDRKPQHSFTAKMYDYFLNQINADYDWYTFFKVICLILEVSCDEAVIDFCEFLKMILIQQNWFNDHFPDWSAEDRKDAFEFFEVTLAESLINTDSIKILHEDKLYDVMNLFHFIVDHTSLNYKDFDSFTNDKKNIRAKFIHDILTVFH